MRSRNGGPRAQSRDDGWRGAGGEVAAGSGEARRVDSRVTRATTLLLLSVLSQTASIHGLIEGAEQFRNRVDPNPLSTDLRESTIIQLQAFLFLRSHSTTLTLTTYVHSYPMNTRKQTLPL